MASFEVLMVFPNVSTVGMSHESIRFNRRKSSSTILQIIDFTFPGDSLYGILPSLTAKGLTRPPHTGNRSQDGVDEENHRTVDRLLQASRFVVEP